MLECCHMVPGAVSANLLGAAERQVVLQKRAVIAALPFVLPRHGGGLRAAVVAGLLEGQTPPCSLDRREKTMVDCMTTRAVPPCCALFFKLASCSQATLIRSPSCKGMSNRRTLQQSAASALQDATLKACRVLLLDRNGAHNDAGMRLASMRQLDFFQTAISA